MLAPVLAALALAVQVPRESRPAPSPPSPTAADSAVLTHANGRVPPVATAVRVERAPAPTVDGRLDDPAWEAAPAVRSFTQTDPLEGRAPSESTEVRILYDDDALYIGARMYDSEPGRIRARLGRRDSGTQSDMFSVAIDSYHDHRTTFEFRVNPVGVRGDWLGTDDAGYGDDSWDPVYDAAAHIDSLGWTAEFRIPFSQLRFPSTERQVWGINFWRQVQRKAEWSVFAFKLKTEPGFASAFGHLLGLSHLPQPRRLEALPYATVRGEYVRPASAGDPFNDGSRHIPAAGLDLKYGLTSDLTLDATINPDFGQVEADPAVVNLSAFETYFQERRPFFVEGSNIFSFGGGGGGMFRFGGGGDFFYSRRIGRSPQGYADSRGGFVDQPDHSTILGAAKISGRTRHGWSVGLLEAVTAREHATVDSSGVRFRDEVEPLTNYLVTRLKRDFARGSSGIGLLATAVNRDIGSPALRFLRSAAYAGGVDFFHRFSRNRYSLSGTLGGSYIRGDTLAIQWVQLSSARYYQRPDADYVEYDPTRTSLAGWTGSLSFDKVAGDYGFSLGASATSPGFEVNDAGFQTSADNISASLSGNRRWTRPGKVFRFANVWAFSGTNWNFGGVSSGTFVGLSGYGQLLNYWSANASLNLSTRGLSDGATRGGPLMVSPQSYSVNFNLGTDSRKSVTGNLGGYHSRSEFGGRWYGVWSWFNIRPSGAFRVSLGPGYSFSRSIAQFVTSQSPTSPAESLAAAATFGGQYVFAEIVQRSVNMSVRMDVTFSPTLSLQLYVQPFVATGDYRRFKELARARSYDFLTYGETPGTSLDSLWDYGRDAGGAVVDSTVSFYLADGDGPGPRRPVTIYNPDFAFGSLRGNAVLRWEYRPGSTIFLVWSQSRSAFERDPRFSALGSLGDVLLPGRPANVFLIKFNYWLSL